MNAIKSSSPKREAETPDAIVLTLPFPVSVNSAFRKFRGKHLSERYRAWRDVAGWTLKLQKPGSVHGPVEVLVELRAPDRRKRDADNLLKATLDLLVAHGLIDGDHSSVLREVRARWIDDGRPRAVVSIRRAT